MLDNRIETLRSLRKDAATLNESLEDDLRPFLHKDEETFRRLPTSASASDISVSTTCTALMALAGTGKIDDFYNIKAAPHDLDEARREKLLPLFQRVVDDDWNSSGLPEDNAFTATIIIRTAGFLVGPSKFRPGDFRDVYKNYWRGYELTLESIAKDLTADIPGDFRVDETLRENPALGYWLVDGVDRLNIRLTESRWRNLAAWASREFTRQQSLIVARDYATMDPVAMALAACLAERLRKIAAQPQFAHGDAIKAELPTSVELICGLEQVFDEQNDSGIWDKYFPMFYYSEHAPATPVARGGANYCFTFEFLEAILDEFGTRVATSEILLNGLSRATSWCRRYRLHYHHNKVDYRGWNSGQQRDGQTLGKPESWATGVVHMYLSKLCSVLSEEIRNQLLSTYHARKVVKPQPPKKSNWEKFMDVSIDLIGVQNPTSVKTLLKKHMLDPIGQMSEHVDRLECRHSALLFGPPGTSKTSIVEAVAEQLNWPFLEITPSHFLSRGLERIYEQANDIFDDLMDLSKVVILFDEMDALVQRRSGGADAERIDVTRQFLTTSMLPKLAKLYKQARVVFFMATNHQRDFDEAIKRPGRFDLLLCMGPPAWSEKEKHLDVWLSDKEVNPTDVKNKLRKWASDKDTASMLDRFTFGEMRELFDHLASQYGSLTQFVDDKKKEDFKSILQQWCNHSITLRNVGGEVRNPIWDEYEQDKHASKVQ